MQVLRHYYLRVAGKESVGSLFERVAGALEKHGQPCEPLFYLGDGFGQVSACERAVKRFPILKEFLLRRSDQACDLPMTFDVHFKP